MRIHSVRLALTVALLAAGCRHHVEPEPLPAMRPHCWWNSQYLAVAPVWVASRFESAMESGGYPNPRMLRDADSAWATANPRPAVSSNGPAYSFRVVAYPASDSVACAWRGVADAPIARKPAGALTCFHVNALIYRPTGGWTPADSEASRGRVLSLCGDLYKEAVGDLVKLK